MGVNLAVLRRLPESSRASGSSGRPSWSLGRRGSPPGSSGHPGHRSTPSHKDLVIIMYKHKDQSAKVHKNCSNKTEVTTKPTLTGRS